LNLVSENSPKIKEATKSKGKDAHVCKAWAFTRNMVARCLGDTSET